jgi:hypothetical protein
MIKDPFDGAELDQLIADSKDSCREDSIEFGDTVLPLGDFRNSD